MFAMNSEARDRKLYILSSQLAEDTKRNNVVYIFRMYYNVYRRLICANIHTNISEFQLRQHHSVNSNAI